MYLNINQSQLLRRAKSMPELSHDVGIGPDRDLSRSEVLEWISQQPELLLWIMVVLRNARLIVKEASSGKLRGNANWDGRPKDFPFYRNGVYSERPQKRRARGSKKKAGRKPNNELFTKVAKLLIDQPLPVADWVKKAKALGLSSSSFYRFKDEMLKLNQIHITGSGVELIPDFRKQLQDL